MSDRRNMMPPDATPPGRKVNPMMRSNRMSTALKDAGLEKYGSKAENAFNPGGDSDEEMGMPSDMAMQARSTMT